MLNRHEGHFDIVVHLRNYFCGKLKAVGGRVEELLSSKG